MSISKRIEELCIKNNISIAELERRLNFGNSTIRKWDKSFPSVDKVTKVADYFHVTVEYLVKGIEDTSAGIAARKFGSLSNEEKEAIENMIDFYIAKKLKK